MPGRPSWACSHTNNKGRFVSGQGGSTSLRSAPAHCHTLRDGGYQVWSGQHPSGGRDNRSANALSFSGPLSFSALSAVSRLLRGVVRGVQTREAVE
jgi:hypothetical protein